MKRLLLLAAMLALNSFVFAGEKTVYGTLVGPNISKDTLTTDGDLHAIYHEPTITLSFPGWNGQDEFGNFIGYDKLKAVKLAVDIYTSQDLYIEQITPLSCNTWYSCFDTKAELRLDPSSDKPDFGGSCPVTAMVGSAQLSGFDGIIDGAGTSGFRLTTIGFYPTIEETTLVGKGRGGLGRWAVRNQDNKTIQMKFVSEQTGLGFAGYWKFFGQSYVKINDTFSQHPIRVTYIYDNVANPYNVYTTDWEELPMIWADDFTPRQIALLGFPYDPSRVKEVVIDVQNMSLQSAGLENISNQPGICGGMTSWGFTLRSNDGYGSLMSNMAIHSPVGSSNTFLDSFDGIQDFGGTSGLEHWPTSLQNINNQTTYTLSSVNIQDFAKPWFIAEYLSNGNYPNYVSLTPGVDFAWWHKVLMTGRVRLTYKYL